MARDKTFGAVGVTTTSYIIPRGRGTANAAASSSGSLGITRYLSGYNVRETAGAAAVIKIRDSLAVPAVITSAADGAAGNSTVGLHMYLVTWVTVNGEGTYGRNAGDRLEHTTAGSKIVNLTGVPIAPVNPDLLHARIGTTVIGRRLYATKAGAPATTVTPTRAQWFLVSADLSTTLAAGMNALSLPQSSITVASTTSFAAAGNILVTTADGVQAVAYTSVDATHFLGATGGSGTMSTGGAVTQPVIGDNTTTTFALNLADGSFTATNPPLADTAGALVKGFNLAASESVDIALGPNVVTPMNDGGFAVEINSGTVDFELVGQ